MTGFPSKVRFIHSLTKKQLVIIFQVLSTELEVPGVFGGKKKVCDCSICSSNTMGPKLCVHTNHLGRGDLGGSAG